MNPLRTPGKDGMKILIMLACAFIISAGLQAGREILVPIVLAGFLAIVSYPLTKFFRLTLKFPHWLAVAFTVILDFGVLVALGYLANFLGQDLAHTVTHKYQPMVTEQIKHLRAWLVENDFYNFADHIQEQVPKVFNGQRIVEFSTGIMGRLASMLTFITIVLILMTFFLIEAPLFKENIKKLNEGNKYDLRHFSRALSGVQKYLIIKIWISALTGLLAGLTCYVAGIDFPLLWGIVAFLLNFIPNFGSIIAAIPPILLSMLLCSPAITVGVGLSYLIINMILGNILEPTLMGKQFGISSSVVLLCVMYWGLVWGPIGMLLAVPITMLIKLGLENSRDLSWLARLIDVPVRENKRFSLTPPPAEQSTISPKE